VRFSILARLQQAIRWQVARRASAETIYALLIPAVGLLTGFAALGIAHVLVLLQRLLWGSGENLVAGAEASPWWHRLVIPALGGATIGLLGWLLKRDVRGSGTAGLIESIALRGGRIRLRQEGPAVLAGIVTVSTGGSLGREGPMIEFAAVLGSWLGRVFGLNARQVSVLVCCAAGAAISAVYNAPIGGSIFVMEILIGTFALEIFGPVVIASVLSTFVFRAAVGQLPRFVIPEYSLVSAWELVGYLVLGVLCGGFSVAIIRFMGWVADGFHRMVRVRHARPIVGFLLLGAIGIAFPHVFGNGYETVNLALHEQLPLTLLLVLPFLKLVAMAMTRGSGGSGGVFTPTLMLGALVGGAFGYAMHAAFPAQTAEYGAYAIVGMGAVLAGTTHAPIMAIMMIFEQTNSYPIILPLMLGCIVSNQVARRLKPESLHRDALRRRGVVVDVAPEASVMRSVRVADVMHDDLDSVEERDPFSRVIEYFLNTPRNFLYVVDEQRRFTGAIPLHAIKQALTSRYPPDLVLAADLVEPFEFVTPDQHLADVMETFWRQHAERLPVVADRDSGRLVGWISQRDLIGVYSQEILHKRHLLARFMMPDASGQQREAFVELPEGFAIRTLVVPRSLEGRTLAEIAPRSVFGVHVLQIRRYNPFRRRNTAELPGPDSVLRAYDRLVVIGSGAGMDAIQRTLSLEPGNPA
jgi:CIC family chloride channel protein